jgi:hypothetical protein
MRSGIAARSTTLALAPGEAERSDVKEPSLRCGSLASCNKTQIVDAPCAGENVCGENAIVGSAAGRFNLDFADQCAGWVVQTNFEGAIVKGSVF